jgi:hypothetical protein
MAPDGFPSARSLRFGAAALAVVLVGLVGGVVGRATAGSAPLPPATATQPVASDLPSWAQGATRMDHGVPVGYAHTRDGALAAARNYSLALGSSPLTLDPASSRAAQQFLDVPSFRAKDAQQLERDLAGASHLIAAAHQGHATRVLPFIYTGRLDSYSGDDAQVTFWGGAVIASDGVLAPQLTLGDDTISLHWFGDWLIADSSTTDGPGVAVTTTTPAQTKNLPPELGREFKGVGDVFP